MAAILILYSSVDGHTLRIGERLQQCLEHGPHRVTLASLHASLADLARFDRIVIGASVRYGKFRSALYDFVREHAVQLERCPTAFFAVCAVARAPRRADPQHNHYVQRFLRRVAWRPHALAVFAGKIDYPRYGWMDRWMIRLIMRLTHGPTDPRGVFEFTDWREVERFAERISALP